MSTFLELTNKALTRLNEVPLTSVTFASATGFHSVAKEAVNNSIREINRESHEWPFNRKDGQETLVADQTFYDYPVDAKVLDFDTFRITYMRDTVTGYGVLRHIDYDSYIQSHYVTDQNIINSGSPTIPSMVFKYGDKFGVTRVPSHADVLNYTYWGWSDELVAYTDITDIPERYDDVIMFGVLRECYEFRTMNAQSQKNDQMFYDGIKGMRTQLLNDFVAVKDTRIGC
jgi:hypothetical protein